MIGYYLGWLGREWELYHKYFQLLDQEEIPTIFDIPASLVGIGFTEMFDLRVETNTHRFMIAAKKEA